MFLFGPFLGIYYPIHEGGNRPRMVVLPSIVVEIASRLHLNLDRLPKRIPDQFPIIPIGKISTIRFPVNEKKVIFSIFNFGLLLDGHHETLLIVETVPPKVPGLPLDHIDQSKRTVCAS